MILQFSLGLYATVYAAKAGCESVIRRSQKPLPNPCFSGTNPTDPTSGLYDMRLRGTVVYGNRIYYRGSCIWCGTFLLFIDHLGDTHSDHLADLLAFSVVVYLMVRSKVIKVPIPSLLKIMVRDATHYFLLIFTSHFVLLMFLIFASVSTSSQSPIPSIRLAHTFIGSNQATPCPVSDTRMCVPFVRLPEPSLHNSGNFVYVRTPLCFPKHRV